MNIEIYADVPLSPPREEALVQCLDAISGVRLYADRRSGDPSWSEADLSDEVKRYQNLGLRVRCVYWPRSNARLKDFDRIIRHSEWAGQAPVLNVEGNILTKSHRRRYASRVLANLPKELRFDTVLTTHPGHPESFPSKALILRDGRREIQAYSTSTNIARTGPRALPFVFQKEAAERSASFGLSPEIALACYGQTSLAEAAAAVDVDFVLDEPHVHMRACLEAAHYAGVTTATYWSLKHLTRNDYALPFFRDVAPAVLERLGVLSNC